MSKERYCIPHICAIDSGLNRHNEFLLGFLLDNLPKELHQEGIDTIHDVDDNIVYEWNCFCPNYKDLLMGILPEMNYYFVMNNIRVCCEAIIDSYPMIMLGKTLVSYTLYNPTLSLVFVLYKNIFLLNDFLVYPSRGI